jgi:Secretion system C-terminal sorting domain
MRIFFTRINYTIRLVLTFCILFSYSCNQFEQEMESEEKEEKGEAIKGFDLWSDMRTYPNKELNARAFSPGFDIAKRMNLQSRSNELGLNLPNTAPWTELAPKNFAGRAISLAFHPTNPNIMFVGTASGGLWKTTNGGTGGAGGINWQFVPTGFPLLGVGSIAINPLNPNEMYVGSGEVYNTAALAGGATGAGHIRLFRGTYGIGILKSTDGGVSWSKVLDFSNSSIRGVMDLAIHPTTPSTVFAATSDGVYRTTNSGTTWTLIHNVVLPNSLEFKPGNPNILYVGSGNFGSAGNGIYKTVNANAATPTFTKLTSGLPATITGKIMLSMTAANSSVIYASIGDNPDNTMTTDGLYKSTNEGASWTAMRTGANSIIGGQGWYAHAVGVSSTDANEVVWGELDTYRSANGGSTFTKTGAWNSWDVNNTTVGTLQEGLNDNYVHADVHRIICSPHDASGNTFFLCTDGGIFRTTDGGLNFQTLNGGLNTAQIYSNMSVSPVNSNYMLLGLQDNEAMVYNGSAGCRRIGGLGDGFHSAINSTGAIQLVESYYFNVKRSTNSGSTFGGGSGAVPELACFNVPMVYSSAVSSSYMFAGTIYFKRSTDNGATWANLNGGAPIAGANNPAIAMNAPSNSIVYFSTAPGGSVRSKLWKTTNATVASPTFTEITGTLPDRYYSDIAVDPTNSSRIAVSLSGFGSSHVYISTNGGTSWCNIGAGLPDVPTNSLAFDPVNPGSLYVGNDIGVFYAYNIPSGVLPASYPLTWIAYNEGFTDAILANDLLITSTGKIRLGSYGRGLWERDLAPYGTLPAKVSSFNVNRVGNINQLSWEVTEEVNVDRYEVEYSVDGQNFAVLTSLNAKTDAQGIQLYRYAHTIDRKNAAYYRIRIIDNDGQWVYTSVLKISAESVNNSIYLYPNPTRGIVNIHVPVASDVQAQMRVIDMSGKIVKSTQVSLKAGVQEFTTDLSALPDGTYKVILDGKGMKWSGTVIKTK